MSSVQEKKRLKRQRTRQNKRAKIQIAKVENEIQAAPANLEILGDVWIFEIIPLIHPQVLLALFSTCKFMNEMSKSLPNLFWFQLCKTHFDITPLSMLMDDMRKVYISNALDACYLCHCKRAYFSELANLHLCYNCRGKPPFEVISKTMAMKTFHIKESALRGLNFIECQNSFRRSQSSRFYLKHDVEKIAFEFYGSREAWSVVDEKSKGRKEKIAQGKKKKQDAADARRQQLIEALNVKGLSLLNVYRYRGIYDEFIQGTSLLSIEEIVHKILVFKIVTEECKFEKIYRLLMQQRGQMPILDLQQMRQNLVNQLFQEWAEANPEKYQEFLLK